jgi:hypothetical protein
MADLIINSITYSGSPTSTANPQRPLTLMRRRIKIGKLMTGADGSLAWVRRGEKWEWELDWGERANQTTETAVLAVRNLTTTFPFVDHLGASFTALCVGDDSYEETVTTDKANAYKYALKLTIREA